MTRRRGVARRDDGRCGCWPTASPRLTLVGKTWSLHLEKVVRVDRDENLRMIAESVEFLVGEGKTVVYDCEHFFDGWREDRDYALRCARAAAEAGAAWVTLCDTNGASLPHEVAAATAAVVAALGHAGRDPLPQRRRVRRGQLARRGAGGRRHGAGDDERLRRALRQREPRLDHPQPPAQDGLLVPAGADGADRGVALPRRAAQLRARPEPAVRRRQRVRAQGRHARRRRAADPATFEHIDPIAVGNAREVLISELKRQGTARARRGDGRRARRAAAARVVERSSSSSTGLPLRGRRGSFDLLIRRETATTSRSSGWIAGA